MGDIGGTSMKLARLDAAAAIRARHNGPGANIRSAATPEQFADALAEGIGVVLADTVPSEIELVYLAVTGAGGAGRARIAAAIDAGLARTPLAGVARELTDDITAAFLANTEGARTGVLALAGTGAVQAAVCDGVLVRRTDGLGWVLGDTGSGTWLGQQILRAVAADLDGVGRATALTDAVVEALEIPRETQALIGAVDQLKPAQWGRFAALLTEAAASDAVAQRILAEAAEAIARGVDACATELRERGIEGELPLVWAGGVAEHCVPLREAVRARVRDVREVAHREPIYGVVQLALDALRRRP
ncbi:hypothetical protein BSZ39_07750 [Bowdeniella nasicola]|uniref:ATPase BadF/BadG/BcrA/BcrD type domain-containing protein n=1 Tax=Bowdeniella nasicola TaxID=208480 RepID=A0A1Q5Q226_9ACTO|nr:hypothetical protein BSZ39_07750 [Bowdeniella nasicola]